MILRYLIYNYLKYITIFLFLFLITVWISQIIRLIEFGLNYESFYKVINLTVLALPSYIINVSHLIILFGAFFFSYKLNSSSEIIILRQYLNKNNLRNYLILTNIFMLLIIILNSEFISQKLYNKYKQKEVELRSNFNIQVDGSKKELRLNDQFIIFFDEFDENRFINPITIIYSENLIVKSKIAKLSYQNDKINLEFLDGTRVSSDNKEKSMTNFKNFNFYIENLVDKTVLPDKESYSVIELISQKDQKLYSSGHNKIINYLLLIVLFTGIHRIVLSLSNKNSKKFKNIKILIVYIIFVFTISSLSKYLLLAKINLVSFYCIGAILLTLFKISIHKIYDLK
tara:strand:- start:676 stop:1701 length:1026 start_codon:yes stop_codon:yes gene_type:complete